MLGFNTFSQVLFQSSTEQRASEQEVEEWLEERFKDDEAFISYQFIDVNLNSLEFDSVEVDLFDNKFKVKESNKDIRGLQNFSWYGISVSEEGENTVLFSTLNDDMQGVVRTREKVIAIETYNDDYIAIELDPKNFPECGMETTGNEDDDNPTDKDNNSGNKGHSPSSNSYSTSTIKSTNDFSCKIRVLVAYTPSAVSNISNIQNHAQACIFQMNQSFINSEINNVEVELALAYITPYTESETSSLRCDNEEGDMFRFRQDGDGHMDEVHDLREEFSADVCILLNSYDVYESSINPLNDFTYYGVAAQIKASSDNAFCLSHYFYSLTAFTFTHEIGHLIGCRHDVVNDLSIEPYPHGHGFIYSYDIGNLTIQERTIMGTGSSCDFCQRRLYWSNPNLIHPVFGQMGTTAFADNARVIEENFENFMSHRPNTGTLIANQNRINTANESTGYLYHANQILSDENGALITSEQNVSFIAGNRIELRSFSTESGASFEASIVACGEPDGLPADFIDCQLDSDPNDKAILSAYETNKYRDVQFKIYPNPSNEYFMIDYLVEQNENINISLFSYTGKEVKTIYSGTQIAGTHNAYITTEKLAPGVYFIIFKNSDTKIVEKIIIGK